MSKTMAEIVQPKEGRAVEFWTRRMSGRGEAGTGIPGWFRGGLFWSHDNSDHWATSEVVDWAYTQHPGGGK